MWQMFAEVACFVAWDASYSSLQSSFIICLVLELTLPKPQGPQDDASYIMSASLSYYVPEHRAKWESHALAQ